MTRRTSELIVVSVQSISAEIMMGNQAKASTRLDEELTCQILPYDSLFQKKIPS